jgi:hypothetical protein
MKSNLRLQATVVRFDEPDPTGALDVIALFNPDGTPFTGSDGGAVGGSSGLRVWDALSGWVENDIVVYGERLWICYSDVPADPEGGNLPPANDANHWDAVLVGQFYLFLGPVTGLTSAQIDASIDPTWLRDGLIAAATDGANMVMLYRREGKWTKSAPFTEIA